MTSAHVGNSSFSKVIPILQVAWDSTSLGTFKECPYKYYLSVVEGWQPKQQSHHLTFGLLYHSCLEIYDREIAKGMSHEEAVLHATRHAFVFSGHRETTVVDPLEASFNTQQEELLARGFRDSDTLEDGKVVFTKFIPWQTDITVKTRYILVRSIVWYLEEFGENDVAKTVILADGRPAVELSFRVVPGWELSTGEQVILCGHLDRVAEFNSQLWTYDRKTTKSTMSSSFFSQFSPSNQMSFYSAMGKVTMHEPIAGVIIDGAQLAVNFTRFGRGFAHRTPNQLEEWMKDAEHWIKNAEHCATTGHYPMNDTSCDKYGGCKYREHVCTKDPSVRVAFLESNFERRVWDPLKSREV